MGRNIGPIPSTLARAGSVIDDPISNKGVIGKDFSYLDVTLSGTRSVCQNGIDLFKAPGIDYNINCFSQDPDLYSDLRLLQH